MKYFGLAALALAMTVGASASTVVETCGLFGASASGTTFSSANNPIPVSPASPATCAGFSSLGATNNFVSVQLVLTADFTGGTTASNSTQTTFGGTVTDILTVSGGGTSSTYSDSFGSPNDTCGLFPCGSNYYILTASGINAANYTSSFNETYSVAVTSGNVQGVSGQIYAVLTYSSAVPEPGSLMMLGGGLLAFAFAGRKLVRK